MEHGFAARRAGCVMNWEFHPFGRGGGFFRHGAKVSLLSPTTAYCLRRSVRASDVPMSESTTKITEEFGLFVFDTCCDQFVVGKEFGGHHEHSLCEVLEDVFFGFLSVVYDVSSSPDRGFLADSK